MMRAEASFVAYKSCFENNHLKYCRKFNKLKFRPCSACQKYDSISTFTAVFFRVILFWFGLVFGNHKYYSIFYKNIIQLNFFTIVFSSYRVLRV